MNENLDSFKDELRKELVPYSNSIFEIKSANQFIEIAKNRPIPRMLFGELWFEGEICILFAIFLVCLNYLPGSLSFFVITNGCTRLIHYLASLKSD